MILQQKTKATKTLIRLGYTEKKSSLFNLRWYSLHLFHRAGICYLHESLWGNWKRHLIYLGIKYGDLFCLSVHTRLKNLKNYWHL